MLDISFIQEYLKKDKALCIYRYPNEKEFSLLIGSYSKLKEFKDLKDGFVIENFDSSKGYFIEPEIQKTLKADFSFPDIFDFLTNSKIQDNQNEKSFFKKLVEDSIRSIEQKSFQKLVPSRKKEIPLNPNFDAFKFLNEIAKIYSSCFCYLFLIPNQSCWIGASPELLSEFKPNDYLKTVSLAGTQTNSKTKEKVEWSEKERVEQERVSNFIREKINQTGIEDFDESKAETFDTGNLYHIKSNFNIKSKHLNPLKFLSTLHPTPAVAGIPQKKAMEYLISNEAYDREFYSGYIGETSSKGVSRLHVNLRCLQLFSNKIILYAGAGITEGSVPENEFLETENKMDSLLKYIDAPTISL